MSNDGKPADDEEQESEKSEDSDYDSEFDTDDDEDVDDAAATEEPEEDALPPEDDHSREANIKRIRYYAEMGKEAARAAEESYVDHENQFDFPKDKENWTEEDLQELWADAPLKMKKPGWDPNWADEEDWKVVKEEIAAGRDPKIAPFYVPYRKPYPVIPDNHHDIKNAKSVIEELDRIEEFLTWVSYIFQDGSSYEGTVWDDLAHGKGVLVAEDGMVRYEGEWLQNNMEGHGVIEVEIPEDEPIPGSELEAQMRAEGRIIKRDYMSPEDREWLEMDIEDSIRFSGGEYEIPFYENDEWVKVFGKNPEKGRYRYAGQWKHSRMHGCGVYYVNERPTYGRFYFGELLNDSTGCEEEIATMHGALGEVAAAKARMFMNKPDGMVREERGPYSDPQHPYFYEEDQVWQAPGFIYQFYEVPDPWKIYVSDLDTERQMWLNSFYHSPLRMPMPAELEYWWEKDEEPEFITICKEPEPDSNDPSKLIFTEDPLILHTRSGRIINYTDDPEHGIRMFWQPTLKEGETIDLEKVEFLPLGYDEFFGREEIEEKPNAWERLLQKIGSAFKPYLEKIEKWAEEKKEESEMKLKLLEKEMELIEAELSLKEALEEMAEDLKREEEEVENMALEEAEEDVKDVKQDAASPADQSEKTITVEEQEKEEDEEEGSEEDDDDVESSFGSTGDNQDTRKDSKPAQSPFSAASLLFAPCTAVPTVPPKLQQLFASWKSTKQAPKNSSSSLCNEESSICHDMPDSICYPRVLPGSVRLRADTRSRARMIKGRRSNPRTSQLHSLSQLIYGNYMRELRKQTTSGMHVGSEKNSDGILTLNLPVQHMESDPLNWQFSPVCLS
uniref:MORN repeat-containing protein n=1 Tax=Kalanchoe fedtschenkoi TaxID=63787 RepID=A0A7N0RD03_KALFE